MENVNPYNQDSGRSVVSELRQQTHSEHVALENHAVMKKLMGSEATIRDYTQVLVKFHGFYRPLEESIRPYCTHEVNSLVKLKYPLLEKDLACFHQKPGEFTRAADLPQVNSCAGALGVLYVLEGATLGGKLIRQHLQKQLGIRKGLHFFSCYDKEVGSHWRSFQQLLNTRLSEQPGKGEAIEAASRTFIQLGTWLTRGMPA